jgi:hypothetical protein
LTRSQALGLWVLTIALMAIGAGQNWGDYSVSADAGGGSITVNGFGVFPVIGTLIGLQVISILLSFLVRPIFVRVMSGFFVPIMFWNLVDVLINASTKIEQSVGQLLAEKTGVIQEISGSDFVIASASSSLSLMYALAVGLNIGVLGLVTARSLRQKVIKQSKRAPELPEDLWSDQK